MEPGALDHLLMAILVLGMPAWGLWERRWLLRSLAAGTRDARMQVYRQSIAVQWVLVLVLLGLWSSGGRDLPGLGLGFDAGRGFWIGAGLAGGAAAGLVAQTVAVLRNPENLDSVRAQLEPAGALLPRDDREERTFAALSFTAGVCEEILYRGFVIAYFAAFLDTPVAVVLSALVFGVGHAYQGTLGIVKTGAVGLVLAGLYLLTGSLWVPMLLHVLMDLQGGHLGRLAFASPTPTSSPTAD